MALWPDVDHRSGVPLYVQLVERVRWALEIGIPRPGERLPTVRALAGELAVAPNTVVKAYNELQREGLIESRAGVVTVVLGEARERGCRSARWRTSTGASGCSRAGRSRIGDRRRGTPEALQRGARAILPKGGEPEGYVMEELARIARSSRPGGGGANGDEGLGLKLR